MEKMIYCNSCKVVVPQNAEKKCVNCGAVNWGYDTGHDNMVPAGLQKPRQNRKRWVLPVILTGVVILVLTVPLMGLHPKTMAEKKYAGNILELEHNFVYTAELTFPDGGKELIDMIKVGQDSFDLYEPGSERVNQVYATAILVNDEGLCYTSAYACQPWNNPRDTESIRKLIKMNMQEDYTNLVIGGRSLYMNGRIKGRDTKEQDGERIEFLLSGISHSIAAISCSGNDCSFTGKNVEMEVIDPKAEVGSVITMYSGGQFKSFNLARNWDSGEMKGIVIPENLETAGEGAPLFNKAGKLIAINSAFNMDYPGQNENVAQILDVAKLNAATSLYNIDLQTMEEADKVNQYMQSDEYKNMIHDAEEALRDTVVLLNPFGKPNEEPE